MGFRRRISSSREAERLDLAIDPVLPHPAGDELGVLAAESRESRTVWCWFMELLGLEIGPSAASYASGPYSPGFLTHQKY